MKRFVVFLVVINLLVFGYYWLKGMPVPQDMRALETKASQIQVVMGNAPRPPAASEASAAVAASATPAVASQAQNVQVDDSSTKTVCLRWSGISAEQIDGARKVVKDLGVEVKESGGGDAKVWVYIPPQPDQDTAKSKAKQLAELGVDDYFVVNNGGKWQNAISLGVYSSKEAADRRLEELRNKGVRSAVVRDKDDTLKPFSFHLNKVSAAQREQLEKAGGQMRGTAVLPTKCH